MVYYTPLVVYVLKIWRAWVPAQEQANQLPFAPEVVGSHWSRYVQVDFGNSRSGTHKGLQQARVAAISAGALFRPRDGGDDRGIMPVPQQLADLPKRQIGVALVQRPRCRLPRQHDLVCAARPDQVFARDIKEAGSSIDQLLYIWSSRARAATSRTSARPQAHAGLPSICWGSTSRAEGL